MSQRNRHILVMLLMTAVLFPLVSQEKLPIAVMDFKITKLPEDEVELLVDFFNNALFETGVFDVIQKSRRDFLISEIQFSYSDASDSEKTRELGKLLSSKFLVFGSIGQLGKQIIFNLFTVDVETGQTVSSFSENYGSLEEILDDLPAIASDTARFARRASFLKKAELLFAEDFERSGDWIEDGLLFYQDGEYHIYSPDAEYYTWRSPILSDFVYEVQARWIDGETDFGYGIIFRVVDGDNYYLFDITQNGFFKLDVKIDGSYYEITPWVKSSAINPDGKNRLKVEAVGQNLALFINNLKVEEIVDDTFQEGEFGFFAAGSVHAAFDNMKLYRGDLLVYNSFTAGAEDWVADDIASAAEGEYRLQPSADGYYSWRAEELSNISFQAETRWLGGSIDLGYGLVFRLQDIDNHYIFFISRNGYYKLGMYESNDWYNLIDWKKSRYINEEGKNLLRVEMLGNLFKLYINGNLVDEYVDDTFPSGKVGFTTTADVKVAFDNVEIFLLE